MKSYKLDDVLADRAAHMTASATSPVIVELQPGASLPAKYDRYVRRSASLGIINSQVVDIPTTVLKSMAAEPAIFRLHYDRPASALNYRTALLSGTRTVQQALGYSGAGVGIAVIDSGIASWHDDLSSTTSRSYPYGNQRVAAFVDFVNGRSQPYDDYGHGTHVAGIIAAVALTVTTAPPAGVAFASANVAGVSMLFVEPGWLTWMQIRSARDPSA